MSDKPRIVAWWLRRDLRLTDNAALYHALRSGLPVLPVFVFDRAILDALPRQDLRVQFIHQTLTALNAQLAHYGCSIWVHYGSPAEAWGQLCQQFTLHAVYAAHDYEPYAIARDAAIATQLAAQGAAFHTYKDQVIFDRDEVLTGHGTPFKVFTPYKHAWLNRLTPFYLKPYATEKYLHNLYQHVDTHALPTLQQMGFEAVPFAYPPPSVATALMQHYGERRNFPALTSGTSRIGIHLRFGTLSIRQLAARAQQHGATYLNELIWRDFYQMVLYHFPHVVTRAFRPQYDTIPWREDAEALARWQQGLTGYPIVDAGMRELNATGYMHNRVRMIVASFLTKHLLISWQLGEAYFAEKLLDFELASNNGGWQWAAGTGADAAPYFRVFSPGEQTKKFDAKLEYIRRWVPEFESPAYPKPIVEHSYARQRALAVYKAALAGRGD